MPNKNEKPQPIDPKEPKRPRVSPDVLEDVKEILRRPIPGTATKTFSN